ncbi:hypothetical protein GWK47_020751 [Chionoecetes opilio]|uniref:Uncharacterized protein n=1 Tax=Chionoecetes opilio TaxID=41210 RepID=A0A8J4XPJ0_CHIOP|nr:hypothetical protein GWK47_020751 [Chionoecetes opilio]
MALRNICPTSIVNGTICVVRGISADVLQLQGHHRTEPRRRLLPASRTPHHAGSIWYWSPHTVSAISHPCCICHDDKQVPGARPRATWESTCYTSVHAMANPTSACQGPAVLMPSKCWRPVESHGELVYPEAL